MKQELAPRGVGIPVLQGREDVNALKYGKGKMKAQAAKALGVE